MPRGDVHIVSVARDMLQLRRQFSSDHLKTLQDSDANARGGYAVYTIAATAGGELSPKGGLARHEQRKVWQRVQWRCGFGVRRFDIFWVETTVSCAFL